MPAPGDTLNRLLVLDQVPDADPVVRVFKNGSRVATATVTAGQTFGWDTSYTVTYVLPGALAATDFVQLIAYVVYGGVTETRDVFAGRMGGLLRSGDAVLAAIVLDVVPDSTPVAYAAREGVEVPAAVTSVGAGAIASEFVATVTLTASWATGNAEALYRAVIGGVSYSGSLWGPDGLAFVGTPATDTTTLLHSPAEIVQQMMIDDAVGSDPEVEPVGDWPVSSTTEPDEPDQSITVYDTTGLDDGRGQTDGGLWSHFGLQFRVRASTHRSDGFPKVESIRQYLSGVLTRQVTMTDGTATYVVNAITRIGQTIYLGTDPTSSKRKSFTVNAMVSLLRTS